VAAVARREPIRNQRRKDPLRRDSDGELRLVLQGDHLEHAPVPERDPGLVSSGSEAREAPTGAPASADIMTGEAGSLEAANRARIVALHQLRSTAPVDFRDTFFGGLWVVLILVPAGVAGNVFLNLGIGWAAGLAVLVDTVGFCLVVGALERRDRKLLREIEKGIVSPPLRPKFHWRSVTPAALVRRIRADLDAINIDDTALEDELEPLYQHGNKMDNGWSGGWR
jgi:hypothetical protein